jgi:hypothetical protein
MKAEGFELLRLLVQGQPLADSSVHSKERASRRLRNR